MATNVEYPTPFEQKVLMHEGVGTEIDEVDLVIPSLTRPDEPFDIRLAITHECGLPCANVDVVLSVKLPDTGEVFDISFTNGAPAVGTIRDVCIPNEGLFRFETVLNGVTYYSNPSFCSDQNHEGIYWGDPHIHTILSLCHPEKCRTLNFCYTAAKHVSLLDWASAADHVSNGRCDFSKWREQSIVGNLYNDAPGFVTLPAYEVSLKGGCGGDNNVYMKKYPEMFVDHYDEGDVSTLSEGVSEYLDKSDYIIVPHHTTRLAKHGEISTGIYPGEEVMPVMEIYSKWGTSEYRGNPNPLHKVNDRPSYAQDLLKKGLPLGFIGGTDSHASLTVGRGAVEHLDRFPGLTALKTGELNRENIVDALKNRQCYAVSKDRILVQATINGEPFGQKMERNGTPRSIEAMVAGKADLERIDIIRNGEVVYTMEPDGWHTTIAFTDSADLDDLTFESPFIGGFVYYYIRVTCRNNTQAWTSPAWFV